MEENIYQTVLDSIINGARFRIDFKSRTLVVNRKRIINNGVYDGNLGIEKAADIQSFLKEVERLYACTNIQFRASAVLGNSTYTSRHCQNQNSQTKICYMVKAEKSSSSGWKCISCANCFMDLSGMNGKWANGSGKVKRTRIW